jgi:hypothetical protein
MHGKFPAIQQNQQNSILFHETIPLNIEQQIAILFQDLFFAVSFASYLHLYHISGIFVSKTLPTLPTIT